MRKQRVIIESIRYIAGHQSSVKIKGKTAELKAFRNVLNRSKKLYEALQNKNARLETIEKLVESKNKAASEFKRVTGQSWPL